MKPSDYVVMEAFLTRLVDLVSRGDRKRIERMGPDYRQAEELVAMTLEERHALIDHAGLQSEVEVKAKPPVVGQWLAFLKRRRTDENTIRCMLLGGASRDMMEKLCGLGHPDYTRYKRRLGLGRNPSGRIRPPDKAVAKIIQDAWREQLGENADVRLATGEDYLAVSQATGVSLRQLWSWTKRQRAAPAVNEGKAKTSCGQGAR